MDKGGLIISLDFELMWGVRDKKSVAEYGEHIRSVHKVIPQLLKLFRKYNTKATIATVGFLFAQNEHEINEHIPNQLPNYDHNILSPYEDLSKLKFEFNNLHYWCPDLIELIRTEYPEQELASHTFSHYYCLEPAQTSTEFEADLQAAVNIANKRNVELTSIVFPRNQVRKEYLDICLQYGITSYRGVENAWYYSSQAGNEETLLKRAFRLADSYFDLSGHNSFKVSPGKIINLPASRFLRPYNRKLRMLEKLKVNRILKDISVANERNEFYHLWWHPHNFGDHSEEMFAQLENILAHAKILNFRSYTMNEIANHYLTK